MTKVKTVYSIVETSPQHFRIASDTTFPDGYTSRAWIGGRHSKKYCFWTLESAEMFLTEWQKLEDFQKERLTG